MCGRVSLNYTWRQIYELYRLTAPEAAPNLQPRFNVSRFQSLPVVRSTDGGRELVSMLWEFVPFWWSKPVKEKKFSTFNAKGEEIREKKTFAPAWNRGQRCIVPVSGFYEWPRPKKPGQPPFYIHSQGGPVLSLAGLWGEWTDPESGEQRLSCTVITTGPNSLMDSIPHHRCPLVIDDADLGTWLTADPKNAYDLVRPPPGEAMSAYRVSSYVNKVGQEGPECIEPA
ncbi:SOS response-associated peptidase [Phaeobacter inhibens]|uniref:SOS response-associated peptidase n=1 Tax=Phaeobacter inhibens TaxID=221822 RepID=UPI0021A895F3|nr:SOS response-associated peptidase [Phaeobacter inhibens]UWR62774.1 SOS response-associated peptidase [Phaeobacter inhibens]